MGKKFDNKSKYSSKDFQSSISNFTEKTSLRLDTKNIIGIGGHSIIFPAVSKGGRTFIAKIMYLDQPDENELKLILNEGSFISNAKHSSIIKSFSFYEIEKRKCYAIIMQKASGTLSQVINIVHKGTLYSKMLNCVHKTYNYLSKYFMSKVLKSLMYFKENNWLHLDIKPDNYLLFGNEIKLSDFTLSKFVDKSKEEFNLPLMGTSSYMAPEYYINKGVIKSEDAEKVDVFALGCMLFKMLFNDRVIKCNKTKESYSCKDVIKDIYESERFINESDINEDIKVLLKKMLHPDIKQRATLMDVVSDKWINKGKESIQHVELLNEDDYTKMLIEVQKLDYLEKVKDNNNNNNKVVVKEEPSYKSKRCLMKNRNKNGKFKFLLR